MRDFERMSELSEEALRARLSERAGADYTVEYKKRDIFLRRTVGGKRWLSQPRLRLRLSPAGEGTRLRGSFVPARFVWALLGLFVLAVIVLTVALLASGRGAANMTVYAFAVLVGIPFVVFLAFSLPMTMYAIPGRAALGFVEENLLKK